MNNNETKGKRYISDYETVKEKGFISRDDDKFTIAPLYSTALKYISAISEKEKEYIISRINDSLNYACEINEKAKNGDVSCGLEDNYFPSDRIFVAYKNNDGERQYYVVRTAHYSSSLTINVNNSYIIILGGDKWYYKDVINPINGWDESYYFSISESDFLRCCEAKELGIRIEEFGEETVDMDISDMVYAFQALYNESIEDNKYPDAQKKLLSLYDAKKTKDSLIEETRQWLIETSQANADKKLEKARKEHDEQLKYENRAKKRTILWIVCSVILIIFGIIMVNNENYIIGISSIFIAVVAVLSYLIFKYAAEY